MCHYSLVGSMICICVASLPVFGQVPITIMQDDLIYGANIGEPRDGSVEWARIRSTGDSAEIIDLVWDQPFIQSIEFDNLDGVSHNPRGNLLGVNYGPIDGGGTIDL